MNVDSLRLVVDRLLNWSAGALPLLGLSVNARSQARALAGP